MENESGAQSGAAAVDGSEVWYVATVCVYAANVSATPLRNWDSRNTSEVMKRCNSTP